MNRTAVGRFRIGLQSLLNSFKLWALMGLLAALLLSMGTGHAQTPPGFLRGTLTGAGFSTSSPTAIAFGPDGRLFVADWNGRVQALTLTAFSKEVTAVEEVAASGDLQEVYGIAFDPTDASLPPPVYVSNTVSGVGPSGPAPAGFPGKITKIDGPGYSIKADIISGLSVSNFGHQTNGLVFAADGTLFIAQGSTTNAGITSGIFPREEVPLSGAVLVADPSVPSFDGAITYDPAGTYAPTTDQVSGDVSVHAPGLRNPYDILIHSNGRLYVTDNGPNVGGGDSSTSCSTEGANPTGDQQLDELNIVVAGDYYGHPNRNRGRFDAAQCVYHAGIEGDGASWTGPITLFSTVSTDGIVEYTSEALGGQFLGDLIYAGFIDGVLGRIVLSPDGSSVVSDDPVFATDFTNPLDLTVGEDGTIYIADFGAGEIVFLEPGQGVGGIARVPDVALSPLGGSANGGPSALMGLASGFAALLAVVAAGAAWYARRRGR